MENEELIKQVTEKAEKWLTPAYDAETQAEIKKMLANPDKTDLIEAFYKDLEFGTGGLRGIMGVGILFPSTHLDVTLLEYTRYVSFAEAVIL